jgi:ABC-type antimicrobial peptide transport system ATPase subunit
MSTPPLLEVEDLRTFFHAEGAVARAVDGISFTVSAGEILAIVGESGSGKSVTSLSIMQLVPTPPGEIAGGRVLFRGRDLLLLSEPNMRRIRGNDIGMIFQEPMSSLNPLLTVGEQIAEVVRLHQGLGRTAARRHAVEMLARVGRDLVLALVVGRILDPTSKLACGPLAHCRPKLHFSGYPFGAWQSPCACAIYDPIHQTRPSRDHCHGRVMAF